MLSPQVITKLKKYFQSQKNILAVYLYGSYAVGLETPASDLDIGIVLDKPISDARAFDLRLKYASGLGSVVNYVSEVVVLNNINDPVFLQQVLAGELIFCRDDDKRVAFEVRALRGFEETRYLRDVQNHYLIERIRKNQFGLKPVIKGAE